MTERDAWMDWRRAGAGASDIAAMAHGIYGGRYSFVAERLGYDVDLGDNADEKARGLDWEQRIADAVHVLTGYYVAGEQTWCEHDTRPIHRATIDGFLAEVPKPTPADIVAVLEIKTVGQYAEHHWARWITQTQWQMYVAGVDQAVIVAVTVLDDDTFGGMRLRTVWADPDQQAALVDIADEAWSWVERGELPPPDCASALPLVKRYTALTAPDQSDTVVDLTDVETAVVRFHSIKQAETAVKSEREHLEALLKDRLAGATKGATESGWTATYSKNSRVLDDNGRDAVLLTYPDLGRTVTVTEPDGTTRTRVELDVDLAKARLGKELDDFKSPIGPRSLTVKPPKGTR